MMDDSPKLYDLAYRNPLLSLQIIIWKWLARSQGYLFGASQKHLNEWGRDSRQQDFSLAYQDREGREPQELLKEVKVKVNSKVYFVITVQDEFYRDFSLYARPLPQNQRKLLLFLCLRYANWNFFPTLAVQFF